MAFLLMACATPDAVVERAAAPVTQPVETVVAPAAEAPVTAGLTSASMPTVPATQPPATPTPAPTPAVTATPPPATPTPAPTPVDLASATSAAAWIQVRNHSRGQLDLMVESEDEWDPLVFHVIVDGLDYINYTPLFPGAFWGLSSGHIESDRIPHASVETVSVRTPSGEMSCERNAASTDTKSVFACAWR